MSDVQNQDCRATSAYGFLEHLNQKLAEIPKKNKDPNRHKNRAKHRNKNREAQLEWRYEESISQQTVPITLLELITTNDSNPNIKDGPAEGNYNLSPKRSLLIPSQTATTNNCLIENLANNLAVEADGG